MRKRMYGWLSLIMVLVMLLSSCSKSSSAPSNDADPLGETEIATPSNPEESAEEPESAPQYLEYSEPIESEIEIFNLLSSGFFYMGDYLVETDMDRSYNDLRINSLVLFTNRLFDLSDDCYALYSSGFTAYEDHLLRHLDTVEMSAYEDFGEEIINGILSYKATLHTLTLEISAYDDLAASGSQLDPTLQGYAFTKSIELADLTDEYLKFLLGSRDCIATVFNKTSPEKAPAFLDFADRIYTDHIAEDYLDIMITYMDISTIHSYITSADYFAGLDFALRINATIDALDESEDAQAIKVLYNNATLSGTAPTDLILPTYETAFSEVSFVKINSNSSITDVSVNETDRMNDALMLLHILETVEMDSRANNSESRDMITAAIMNVITNYNGERDGSTNLSSGIKKTTEATPDLKSKVLDALEKQDMPIKAQVLSLEKEKTAQEKKLEIIQELKDGQKKLSVLGLAKDLEIAFGGDGSKTINTQYTQIIAATSDLLQKKGTTLDGEKFDKINSLMNKDLEVLLGDNKEAFVNKFIETSAEDLVDKFADWKNNALNLSNLDYDKQTLLSLLSSMGIDIRVPEEIVDDSSSEESDEPSEKIHVYDVDELFPEQLSIPALEALGFELHPGTKNADKYSYTLSFGHYRPEEYPGVPALAKLFSKVDARVVYKIPSDKSEPPSRKGLEKYVESAYDNDAGEDYRLTAWISHLGYGSFYDDTHGDVDLLRGNLEVVSGQLTIHMDFYDIMVSEYPKIKAIMKMFASEMVARVGGETTQFETSTQVDPAPVVDSELTLKGKVVLNELYDANNMRVDINYYDKNGNFTDSTSVVTDSQGAFSSDFPYPVDAGYAAVLTIPLVYYNDDDKPIAYITDKEKDISQPIVLFGGEYIVSSDADLDIRCDLYESTAFQNESVGTEESTSSQTYVYFYQSMKEGIDYYQDTLDFEFTSRLPIRFILNEEITSVKDAMGYYNFELDAIHVMKEHSTLNSIEMPNLIYHELSHYVMTMLYYPNYPGDRGLDTDTYHGGYANSYTGYSYSEGFAFFMESILSLHYYGEPAHVHGDLETNHKAWENSGYSETLAVASVLFDLVDTGGDNDESINLPIKDLWKILSHNQRHFGDVYDELKTTYPTLSAEIDQIFIDHGFYVVADVYEAGAGVYNFGEAFVDLDGNYTYDTGETFADYNAVNENGDCIQEYREGYKIGSAGYADNIERR